MALGSVRVRFSGMVLGAGAAAVGAVGYYLTCVALNWVMPEWVPAGFRLAPQGPLRDLAGLKDTLAGQAAAFLLVFAGLAGLNGLWMLLFGRRFWLLLVPLLAMFAMFIAATLSGIVKGGAVSLPVGG